jgi:hypothetical protein
MKKLEEMSRRVTVHLKRQTRAACGERERMATMEQTSEGG